MSEFEYLNRSNREYIEFIRGYIEDWFASYPDENKKDMRSRLQNKKGAQHHPAYFELLLYTLLGKLGYNVEVHPSLRDRKDRPEFLVTAPDETQFYVEAVTVFGKSEQPLAVQNMINRVLECIDKIGNPSFLVGLKILAPPQKSVRTRILCEEIRGWLDSLDPDIVAKEQNRDYPRRTFAIGGGKLELRAIPKGKDLRGKAGHRTIGSRSVGGHWGSYEGIKHAVERKAYKYGRPGIPYVIAVAPFDSSITAFTFMSMLYGDCKGILDRETMEVSEPRFTPPGSWFDLEGPRLTRNSAILAYGHICSKKLPTHESCLYINPNAEHPLMEDTPLARLPRCVLDGDQIKNVRGELVHKLLGVPENWPDD